MSYAALAHEHVQHVAQFPCCPVSELCVPSAQFIKSRCAQLNVHKKWGPDLIAPGALKIDPEASAELLHPLMAKVASFGHEPLSWHGGRLAP
eukprot:11587619-Alexandrium_andersonii.AAC.1